MPSIVPPRGRHVHQVVLELSLKMSPSQNFNILVFNAVVHQGRLFNNLLIFNAHAFFDSKSEHSDYSANQKPTLVFASNVQRACISSRNVTFVTNVTNLNRITSLFIF